MQVRLQFQYAESLSTEHSAEANRKFEILYVPLILLLLFFFPLLCFL